MYCNLLLANGLVCQSRTLSIHTCCLGLYLDRLEFALDLALVFSSSKELVRPDVCLLSAELMLVDLVHFRLYLGLSREFF